jgi:hypothetical protein
VASEAERIDRFCGHCRVSVPSGAEHACNKRIDLIAACRAGQPQEGDKGGE